MRVTPDLTVETALLEQGAHIVVGLDEVGRGAWAGPVSVGAVAIDRMSGPVPDGVADSKSLSRRARERVVPAIDAWAVGTAVGHASAHECDQLGMRAAIALAASRAIHLLDLAPDALVVDGPLDLVAVENEELEALVSGHRWRRAHAPEVVALVKADQTCGSVAAASVVAKVVRDDIMAGWDDDFPPYDFKQNAGYPSQAHQRALRGYGLTSVHRRSWRYTDSLPWHTGTGTLAAPSRR